MSGMVIVVNRGEGVVRLLVLRLGMRIVFLSVALLMVLVIVVSLRLSMGSLGGIVRLILRFVVRM